MSKPDLPTLYINTAEAHAGDHVLYLTLGLISPITVSSPEELERLDTIAPTPVFRCAMNKEMTNDLIELLTEQLSEEAP